MSQWIQMDLLDAIAEAEAAQRKERTRLCPVLEAWEDENIFHKDKLCKSWKDAIKNDCGVFTTNSHMFPVGDLKKGMMTLCLAKVGENIHGEINFRMGAPFYYGRAIPLTEDSSILLSVHNDNDLASRYLKGAAEDAVCMDGNFDEEQRKYLSKLIDKMVANAMESMNE